MLLSIGYQKLHGVDELIAILRENRVAALFDVRSRPHGQRPEFNRDILESLLPAAGIAYHWKGAELGGFGRIESRAIEALVREQKGTTICLLCMEADHTQCHRHLRIGRRLAEIGVKIKHLGSPVSDKQMTLF